MDQEIISTIQRNQKSIFNSDDLFIYEPIDSFPEDQSIYNNNIITTNYSTFVTVENHVFYLKQPIISYFYCNRLLALIYADNTGEVLTSEEKTIMKFKNVCQILVHFDKIYIQECDHTVKEYNYDGTHSVLFKENKKITLIMLKDDMYYLKDGILYDKENKRIMNSVVAVKKLRSNKYFVISDKNNKIHIKIINENNKLEEEMVIEEDISGYSEIKTYEEYIIFSTKFRIFIFKDNLELIDLKEFNKQIKSFDILNYRIKILLGEERKIEEKPIKSKKERYFNQTQSSSDDKINLVEEKSNSLRYQSEVLGGIIDKLIKNFTDERKEREEKEKKRMESLLEKISQQLNLNLRLIIESSVKKELQKITLKGLEGTLCSLLKQLILDKFVPILENSLTEMKIQSKGCEKCSTTLYESFKRDELSRGVELALDSNEELFEEFIKNFDTKNLEHLNLNIVVELYKKTLLIKSESVVPFRNKVFKRIKNQNDFLIGLNEDIILLMPPHHILKLISLIYTEQNHLDLLEELIKSIDITLLNESELNDLVNILDHIENSSGSKERGLIYYCMMQRNFIKRNKKKE